MARRSESDSTPKDFIGLTDEPSAHPSLPSFEPVDLHQLVNDFSNSVGSELSSTRFSAASLIPGWGEVVYGSVFICGSILLRYFPKRPGLFRRQAMLGLTCGSLWMSVHQRRRLNEKIDYAFDVASGDTHDKQFWRRMTFLARCPSATAIIRRAQADEISATALASVNEAMSNHAEYEWTVLSNVPIRTLWPDIKCYLFTSQGDRFYWLASILMASKGGFTAAALGTPRNLVRVPAYYSLLSHGIARGKKIQRYALGGFLTSAAMGLLLRGRYLLRGSLALAVCSLAAQTWGNSIAQRVVDGPAEFVDEERVKEGMIALGLLKDPLSVWNKRDLKVFKRILKTS